MAFVRAIILTVFAVGFYAAASVSAAASSLWSSSAIPGMPASTDAQPVELGVRFTSDISGFVTGIRFYKGVTNTGPHAGKLWTTSGALLGSVSFTNETASGWQEASFSSPIAIAASTQYIASYHTQSGNYAFDANYFTSQGVDNASLHAPAGADNGVYQYGSGGFPSSSYFSSNYWVDVAFSALPPAPDTVPPTVSVIAPTEGAAVSGGINVSAAASDNVGVSGVQFFLNGATLGAEDIASPYSISWNTATVINGVHVLLARARDAAGNTATSSSVTVTVSNGVVPTQGPGGPMLIVASGSNPLTTYYKEILLAEGLNLYRLMDISAITAAELANYDVVILGEIPLSAPQASMLTDWVNNGGNLIAMRPHSSLASLLGISAQGSSISNAYFRVNTASAPGAGIVSSALQFHGTADRYTLNGATEVATLYSNLSTSLTIPAVTARAVGAAGGHAAAFTFDLARSVVYTRQGNPAWSGQDRRVDTAETGSTLIRPMDLFYGAAFFDPQPDWVDFANIEIPQADEAQRLLANMIHDMLAAKKPLPHFWYLPRGEKAAVVMTGDDHGNGGTAGRFDQYLAQSTPGCSVDDWECIRSTSYIFPNSPLTNTQAASYVAQGFEVALHPNAGCQNPVDLTGAFANDFSAFASSYPGVPAPRTIRTHCGPWPDYDTHSQIAAGNHGVRFDTNYYYWPPSWMNDRPGLFTGSGLPMRFTDRDGNTIDAYQAPTQLTDESGQSYPLHIDALLDHALGPQGYYGMFVLNAHTDYPSSAVSDAVVASAQSRGVPMISAGQALDWLDGRNASSFGGISWDAASSTLTFTVIQDARAGGLTTLIPAVFGNTLSALTRNGTLVPFTIVTMKGVSYAQFASDAGAYQAVYLADTIPPAVSLTAPASDATVSGPAVAVSASASDEVGVAGIQFKVDGVDLGAEDTTSPYAVNWNTLSFANGSHTLTAAARDAAGNGATSSPIVVTVSNAPDTTPPVISSVSTGATSNSATIIWLTDENADSQVEYGTTTTYGLSSALEGSLVTNHSVTLNGLAASTVYHYRVKSRDVAGNLALSGDLTVTTSTARQTLLTTQMPNGSFSDGVGVHYELGMRFTSVAAGQITAVRFYKSASESGTHTGRIWNAAGQPLASVVFTGETASGWQEQALATPLTIAANTEYMVSVNTGNTYYVASGTGLQSQIASGDLRTIVGGNGRYGAPGAYPTKTWRSSNYFRDIVFTRSP